MNTLPLIYENIQSDFKISDLCFQFQNNFKVRDFNESVPHEGLFLGSVEGCNWIRKNRPNIYCFATFENYTCSVYYPQLRELLFNDRYVFIPFKDLDRRKWDIYSLLGKEALVFIRPDSGEKDFPAELVDLQDIDKLVKNYDYNGLAVVSSPKKIIGEWRFVVSSKKIFAVSSYRFQGIHTTVPSAPIGATTLVQKVLDKGINPDNIFCVDVAQDSGGEFWVMELTAFSSAGLYACKTDAIIEVIKPYLK